VNTRTPHNGQPEGGQGRDWAAASRTLARYLAGGAVAAEEMREAVRLLAEGAPEVLERLRAALPGELPEAAEGLPAECADVVECLPDYAALGSRARERMPSVGRHLLSCEACALHLAALRDALGWPEVLSPEQLEAVFRACGRVLGEDGAERAVGLSGDFAGRLRAAMAQPAAARGRILAEIKEAYDPAYVVAAGEPETPEGRVVHTSPLWFTHLLAPPAILAWSTALDGPWRVRLWTVEEGDILATETAVAHVSLPVEAIPAGGSVRWEVRPIAPAADLPLVRGIFRVLPSDEAGKLAELRGEPTLDGVLALADLCGEAKLFDSLVARLRALDPADGATAFAVERALAAAFAAVHRELVARRLGDPEGLWAAALARRHADAAYRILGGEGS